MARCENCDAELQPQWKFCVRCGTATGRAIPAAIRPHAAAQPTSAGTAADADPHAPRPFPWHVLIGVVVGAIGIAAVIYLIVVLIGSGSATP